ncbi:hypothetical protein SFBM_0901 [Candidatus Arthromitus sp. SFB-mouse-Japan]|uniref:hypothetical protein n=1 Tax=unclassified Candidatus Neoarthromitus TaxID=2638829 RepID=UPI00021B7EE3|nr:MULTISPECIES: hypothetical protein [unclassified Candidatus Arthromitus]EIA27346.1 Septum formation initiator domain protein [Candidatus Arthromitus sp. SFB-co]EIA28417.1 hypothetical protein SFB4_120G6 [Candidatus Arthromitus sp. SFB-4]EIA30940.1 Septum formation initiator protein [Candidatus Arthromitus sp. SFB-mouse-SU]AID44883.1 Hypothetical protein SFBmNL_00978 [Candidatus Arthromitus sp. SFB-mouse-NL]BAK56667.1 hypothetical protein SFBM_0901 [Candidatus Arthromitus sp. SFB-mouse-Japan
MEENKKIFNGQEEEVMSIKKRSFNIYVRRSFFCTFIFFIICSAFLISSSSKVYKKQREVNVLKSQISRLTEELESLQLEILNLKGFDKVMEYAEFLGMTPAKLGDSVFVDLSKDNFDVEVKEEPNRPFIIRIYDKIMGKE